MVPSIYHMMPGAEPNPGLIGGRQALLLLIENWSILL